MNNKIWIVLKSEFLRRVRSKWFIIGTLIAPIFMIGVAVLPAYIGIKASETTEKSIALVDETGVLSDRIQKYIRDGYTFEQQANDFEALRQRVLDGELNGYLHLPAALITEGEEAVYYSVEGSGLSGEIRLERALSQAVEEYNLVQRDVPEEVLALLGKSVPVRSVKITDEGDEADGGAFYSIIGYIMGFIIYMCMFIYGAYVIQGVLEEKTTRVIEVMVSSVKPFQMLMGKVLGIGAVGMVQIVVWSIMMFGMILVAGNVAAFFIDPTDFNLPIDASQEALLEAAEFTLPAISPMIFVWFVIFFLGGYLLYASLFAAVSSVVEQQQDAQSLLTPIYLLIIIPIMFITLVVENPNGTLSVIMSMIPFFSPILMVVRTTVTAVPIWEVLLSILLLYGSFLGAMWVSSRIYRVGILMYGKKPAVKDLIRWVRYQ